MSELWSRCRKRAKLFRLPIADLTGPRRRRDACCLIERSRTTALFAIQNTFVIGNFPANHQRTVHGGIWFAFGTGVYPISVNGGGIFFVDVSRSKEEPLHDHIPGVSGVETHFLCPTVDISNRLLEEERKNSGLHRRPRLVDVLLPVLPYRLRGVSQRQSHLLPTRRCWWSPNRCCAAVCSWR